MALEKKTVVGKIEILENGVVLVRHDTIITDDGVEVSRTFHREAAEPGADVTTKDQKVQTVAAVVWTQDVIDKYTEEKRRALGRLPGADTKDAQPVDIIPVAIEK